MPTNCCGMEWEKIEVKQDVQKAKLNAAWNADFSDDTIKPWSECTGEEKGKAVFVTLIKICGILAALYFFICSLSFLADGFRLLAGKDAGNVFANSEVFNNAPAGLMIGVLATVFVQSSSTSTSIAISMVGAGLLTVKQAIPIIMGANIGTSVTSTIVALGQAGDRNDFRRAFAAATVHDMFNFLSVAVLLPLEIVTGYLYHLSTAIVNSYPALTSQEKPPDMLKKITKPFTSKIISVDKKIITKIALASTPEELAELEDMPLLKKPKEGSGYLFQGLYGKWSNTGVGILVLIFALVLLCSCLVIMVSLLKSLLKGRIAVWLHASVNGDFPDLKVGSPGSESKTRIPLAWISGYFAMATGAGLTLLVQSSSITTSALTPLVGVGVITLERMYPTVLGANIGTCATGLLAALAADGEKIQYTLAVAYAHLFFNITGIFIWYVLYYTRVVPVSMARGLGNITARYRWFPLLYLFMAFMVIPAIFVALSLASMVLTSIVFVLMLLAGISVAVINWAQDSKPDILPAFLKTWDFLPLPCRSLEPIDRLICAKCTCCPGSKQVGYENPPKGQENSNSQELQVAAKSEEP